MILVHALCRRHRAGLSEPYYLFRFLGTNNCTSSPFSILDEIMTYKALNRIGAQLYRLPVTPRLYLRVRGLDPDPGRRIFVRDEFVDYINHPSTRARKREHVKRRGELKRRAKQNSTQRASFTD
jgi:hypothetical protein